jgi:hypothetical protein
MQGEGLVKKLAFATVAALTLAACSDGPNEAPSGEVITLSASQAAALVGRIESFGASDASLQALADTVDVVIKGGAEARRVDITNDAGGSAFYAVSLHMPNTMSNPASATFHLIAFDDPTNPTLFVILGGWSAEGSGSTAPNTVSGAIGGHATTSLTAHLFSISGNQVSAWHASGGTSYMTAGSSLQLCAGFTGPGTCVKSTMDASFTITGSVAGNGTTGQRTWSGNISSVPGIQISM